MEPSEFGGGPRIELRRISGRVLRAKLGRLPRLNGGATPDRESETKKLRTALELDELAFARRAEKERFSERKDAPSNIAGSCEIVK